MFLNEKIRMGHVREFIISADYEINKILSFYEKAGTDVETDKYAVKENVLYLKKEVNSMVKIGNNNLEQ